MEVQVLSSASKAVPRGAAFRFSVDGVRRTLYSDGEHTFVLVNEPPRSPRAHRPPTGDLELPRRVRRPPRLPADRARDRRAGRARVAVDRARPSREPRARRAAQARPDEAARARADRPRAPRGASRAAVEPADVTRLPLLGEIAAGGPLLAEQNIEEYLPMPALDEGRLPAARQGRVDDRGRHPRRRPRDRAARAGRAERRDRRRARRRRRVARRGDGEDVLPREGPRPAAARELEHSSRSTRRTCRSSAASWGSSGSCSGERRASASHARPGARRAAARRVARVPRLRRVRHARARRVVFCPECGSQLGDEARVLAGRALRFGAQAG